MTWEQWLFEYKALRDKELAEMKERTDAYEAQFRNLRDLLVVLLGLNVYGPKTKEQIAQDKKDGLDPTMPRIVPLSFLTSQPEVMKHYLDYAKRRQAEDESVGDEAFDKFSSSLLEQLKTGQSDLPATMIPLLTEDLEKIAKPNQLWNQAATKAVLESLGVKPRASGRAAPHIAARPKFLEEKKGKQFSETDLEQLGELPSTTPGRRRVDTEIDELQLERYRQALKDTPDS